MFKSIQYGPPDPMFDLKKLADSDLSPEKVDLGVGIYRNEEGKYHELQSLKAAKAILDKSHLGHDYELTTGDVGFINNAAKVLFGEQPSGLSAERVASVQTISGTGANHLGALFLRQCTSSDTTVYIGTPTWGNYEPLCNLVGLPVIKYRYYDKERSRVDFRSLIETVLNAPANSIFILQGCCHNPTGVDLDKEQWIELANAMKQSGAFPFFDIAYQGLGGSLEEDAFGIRLFAERGFEMVVCQSFSKNFGLYGERCGILHIGCENKTTAAIVHDNLRCLIRWEFSSSPAYGSRLVNIILQQTNLTELWIEELSTIRDRLIQNRKKLHHHLLNLKTPGDWSNILSSRGLFCLLPLTSDHCNELRSLHIYLPDTGRINIAGLNNTNVETVAFAIDKVIKDATAPAGAE